MELLPCSCASITCSTVKAASTSVDSKTLPSQSTVAPFVDVLQTAPRLLQLLNSKALTALASTSTQLRSLVHEHVTSITVIEHCGYGTEYQVTELQILVQGNWPQLQTLNLKYRARLEPGAVAQLARAHWPNLVSLDLSRNGLGEAAVSQLIAGNWPALKSVNLSHNKLDAAAIAWLIQADWPLESLELRSVIIFRVRTLWHCHWWHHPTFSPD